MDAQTLSKAMGGALPLARYEALLPVFNAAHPMVAGRSGTASAPTAPLFIFTPAPHR